VNLSEEEIQRVDELYALAEVCVCVCVCVCVHARALAGVVDSIN
jgi:hypothetical protein